MSYFLHLVGTWLGKKQTNVADKGFKLRTLILRCNSANHSTTVLPWREETTTIRTELNWLTWFIEKPVLRNHMKKFLILPLYPDMQQMTNQLTTTNQYRREHHFLGRGNEPDFVQWCHWLQLVDINLQSDLTDRRPLFPLLHQTKPVVELHNVQRI